ncbi:snoRNA-binding protein [Lithohypha guttulata]|uniref:H/ACA ribonucleoprotein complex subunit 2 n=1 Tax=Lithohypha guttulata TaxID=1690604 RepID=A0ABR0KLN5_9EURO|nr:snoRNA-binding protein [Lithohypha guttulata]
MAKDKSLSKEERKAAKKAAKAETSLTESSGISKEKKDKKEKKEKKEKKAKLAEKLLDEVEKADGAVVEVKGNKKEVVKNGNVGPDGEVVSEEELDMEVDSKGAVRPIGALVPFANPLADEKVAKKVFRGVKKAAAQRTLKRGVKEVVKALRKSQSTAGEAVPIGIVVLAADISPMDVISHIPVLCEDHNMPYIYVTSRAELGMAGQTKRPTSVVMISRDIVSKKGAEKSEDGEEWSETFKGLVKVVEREGRHVKV